MVKIKNKCIGYSYPTFLIGEMACAHQGDVSKAIDLVHVAHESKVDAIQLQIFKKDLYISPRHKDYDTVSKIELSQNDWQKVIDEIKNLNMIFFGAGYDLESIKLLIKNNVDAFKIHTSDTSNIDLIKEIGKSRRPVFLSCGASYFDEIQKAINLLRRYGTTEIVLMYGFQAYPTEIEDLHLSHIKTLEEKFKLIVGFYDHIDGDSNSSTSFPMNAIKYGAQVIEKHFTLNRSEKGIDYESSLNPKELAKFQRTLRKYEKADMSFDKNIFSEAEMTYRENVKKTIIYHQDLESGTILGHNDVIVMRSYSFGICPSYIDIIRGKILKRNVKKYDNVNFEDFK